MFTTFQASQSLSQANAAASRNPAKTRRQSSTTQACEECRRRKIRCDGKLPCSHCEWYKHPNLCRYSKKQPRVVPSQKLLDELSASLKQSQKVIQQLFPNADLDKLGELPRAELIELINSANAQTPSSGEPSSGDSASPKAVSDNSGSSRTRLEESGVHLEALEQEPVPYANWDESKTGPSGIPPIPDDVNALSMSVSRQSSYLGVSSIAAALRVISKINKALEHVILTSPPRTAHATRSNSPRRMSSNEETKTVISDPILTESQMVDAYFYHVHPLIPMIDETRFRVRFSAGERKDPSWLALLYMVFALGIIAGSNAEDNSHLIYYNKAKSCIDLDMFGNGHIEALQALGLMGGLYLHYESRPNMANAIMGAAMRMACALGLHREYADGPAESRPDFVKRALLIPREVRRRTWWSLFCMDTWATTTQGRPSLGRISPAVTVLPPSYLNDPPNLSNPASTTDDDAFVLILSHEATFCKIATRIQDRLAETPLLPPEETSRFDLELQHWRSTLPPMFHPSADCPPRALTPRAVMNWRFYNLRLVLHRPLLLNNALRSSLDANDSPSEDETNSVQTCRRIALETIASIRAQWRATQISGWNAVWLLFQASMVPLVTLFAEHNRGNLSLVHAAQEQIENVINLLSDMSQWSITARKTRNFMIRIYAHSRAMLGQGSAIAQATREAQAEQTHALAGLKLQPALAPAPAPHQQANVRFASPPQQQQQQQQLYHSPPPLLPAHSGISPAMAQPALSSPPPPGPHVLGGGGVSIAPHPAHHHPAIAAALPHQHPGHMSHGHSRQQQQPPADIMADDARMHMGPHATFMSQDELNAFWQQVMWGEGDMPEFMMDTSFDYEFVPGQGGGGGAEWG